MGDSKEGRKAITQEGLCAVSGPCCQGKTPPPPYSLSGVQFSAKSSLGKCINLHGRERPSGTGWNKLQYCSYPISLSLSLSPYKAGTTPLLQFIRSASIFVFGVCPFLSLISTPHPTNILPTSVAGSRWPSTDKPNDTTKSNGKNRYSAYFLHVDESHIEYRSTYFTLQRLRCLNISILELLS